MDPLPTAYIGNFLGDIHIAQEAVQNSNVSNNRTVADHGNCRSLCADIGIDHFLNDFYFLLVDTLQVYGHRVRHGHYSKKISVRTYTISSAWRVISTTNILEGRTDP